MSHKILPCGKGEIQLGPGIVCAGEYTLSPDPPVGTANRVIVGRGILGTVRPCSDVSPALLAGYNEVAVCADCPALRPATGQTTTAQ